MSEAIPDYSAFQQAAGATDLETLTGLGLRLRELEQQKDAAQSKVKGLEAQMREISWQQIPELMEKLGVKSFDLADGSSIKVKDQIRISLPKGKERRQEVINWLNDNGAATLIRRCFEISFGKGDEVWAAKFERDCKQRKKPLAIERLETIPPSTLKKFVTDKLAEGAEVPMETLGAFRQTIAEFKDNR